MENINRYITRPCGPTLKSWNDRYSRGVWVVVGDENVVNRIEDLAGSDDTTALSVGDYLCETNWLPFVIGKDFSLAMEKLDCRLHYLFYDDNTKLNEEDNLKWRILCGEVEANIFNQDILPSIYIGKSHLKPPKHLTTALEKGIPNTE